MTPPSDPERHRRQRAGRCCPSSTWAGRGSAPKGSSGCATSTSRTRPGGRAGARRNAIATCSTNTDIGTEMLYPAMHLRRGCSPAVTPYTRNRLKLGKRGYGIAHRQADHPTCLSRLHDVAVDEWAQDRGSCDEAAPMGRVRSTPPLPRPRAAGRSAHRGGAQASRPLLSGPDLLPGRVPHLAQELHRGVGIHFPASSIIGGTGGGHQPAGRDHPPLRGTLKAANILACDGRGCSRTTTRSSLTPSAPPGGPGCGRPHFNLPDLRDRALYRGRHPGRLRARRTGGLLGSRGGPRHNHNFATQIHGHWRKRTRTRGSIGGGGHEHTRRSPLRVPVAGRPSKRFDLSTRAYRGTKSTSGAAGILHTIPRTDRRARPHFSTAHFGRVRSRPPLLRRGQLGHHDWGLTARSGRLPNGGRYLRHSALAQGMPRNRRVKPGLQAKGLQVRDEAEPRGMARGSSGTGGIRARHLCGQAPGERAERSQTINAGERPWSRSWGTPATRHRRSVEPWDHRLRGR